jgi:hypothetical protein
MTQQTDIASQFEPTTVGVNTKVNLINWATGVQIFDGWSMESLRNKSEWYWVGVPATVRNSGVRAVKGAATLEEAYAIAAELLPAAARRMARSHIAALKQNQSH